MNTEDLPESELEKSELWTAWKDECGRCMRCQEMTSVLAPCCGASVEFEGGTVSYEDLWVDIGKELNDIAETKMHDIREAEMKGN